MALETEHEAVKIQELEDQVAALKKENTRLKNEMRFNMDQEKWVLQNLMMEILLTRLLLKNRRSSGEYIASLQRDLEALESRNEEVGVHVYGAYCCITSWVAYMDLHSL